MENVETLTGPQRHLLEWLSGEDFTPLGSCRGSILSELFGMGLVRIDGQRVSVTDDGIARLTPRSE